MIFRFVQLSDIHFGQEWDGTLPIHEDVRRMLVEDAAELAEKRGSANLVIIAGDTAYCGKDSEYKLAGEWLDELTKAIKCSVTDVRVVPGNHDCDRSRLSRNAKNTQKYMRDGSPKSAYADLEDLANNAEEANPLLPKLRAYRDFAESYDSDFISVSRPCWEKDFPFASGVVLRLVGMNSVQVSDEYDSARNMILGNTQYILPSKPHIVYAVVMHHPMDWFMDKTEAEQYLHNRVPLMMVGHEHIPQITKTIDAQKNEWLCIYSGATNPPDENDIYQHTYNWIEISLREKGGSYFLVVNVLPRVWGPSMRFEADKQRLNGVEAMEFEIVCPNLKPTAPVETNRHASVASKLETRQTVANPKNEDSPISSGKTMTPEDQTALAKLKFLFWRYLDWQQRLKVLVNADALPTSVAKPVPQTLERIAIENARKQGKLFEIWEAMLDFLPEDKKEANPFSKTGR